jgi:hypothetical protein
LNLLAARLMPNPEGCCINGRVLVLLKKNLTKIVRHFTIDGTVFSSS